MLQSHDCTLHTAKQQWVGLWQLLRLYKPTARVWLIHSIQPGGHKKHDEEGTQKHVRRSRAPPGL